MAQGKQESLPVDSIEQQYLKERKKSQILTITNAVTVIVLAFAIVWGFQNSANINRGQMPGSGMPELNGGTPPGGPMGMNNVEDFFNDDGSVDTDQVDEVKGNLPEGFEDQFLSRMDDQIDQAVENEDITSDQATELRNEFEIDQ